MFRTVLRAFTSPIAGPVGFALAILMCILLLGAVYCAETNEAALHKQIADLTLQNQRNQIVLHARLAACESAPTDLARTREANAGLSPEERAKRLAHAEPQGFDVCARMESADRAVLETLK